MRAIYAAVIFAGALLLFLIQPIFAKLILPWFGGSAAVWTTCLVFFQTALLCGYLYAHGLSRRLVPRMQAAVHIGLLGVAVLLLPVIPGSFWKPEAGSQDPTWRIFGVLVVVLGLPYFLLSSTSPLVQSWYTRKWPGQTPYRLYSLSNAASLLALASYPFLFEPHLPTRMQAIVWSAVFGVFALLCAAIAWDSRALPAAALPEEAGRATFTQRLTWVSLAAVGSMMLLAVTNQLTQNVAAVPFLWILPLAIYLLTFTLCFESVRWYKRGLFLRFLAVFLGSMGYAIYDFQMSAAIVVAVPLFALGLFVCCMYCHGELNLRKPAAGQLTEFYLMIALGGALGSVLVGIVAPRIFAGIYELPIALFAVALLPLVLNWREGDGAMGRWVQRALWATVAVAMLCVLASQVNGYHKGTIALMRSFYGTLRVVESLNEGVKTRKLYHGTIEHGVQSFDPEERMKPISYYGEDTGIGLAMRFATSGPKRAGLVGLGTGTLAAYGRPGDVFHFYEINPQVIDVANSYFSFTRESRAHVEVVRGDARLSLEAAPPQGFDILVLDAFSGDAIPVHLLTRESFALYLRHLKPQGILAVHVSNQYLNLQPVVKALAEYYKLSAVLVKTEIDEEKRLNATDWVLVTRNREFLELPEVAKAVTPIPLRADLPMWTDDYNNLLQILKFKRPRLGS